MVKLKNKHGWVRIVEAFVAVLIIAGIILIIVDEGYIKKNDPADDIYKLENSILREIQNNDTLRQEILASNIPIDSYDPSFPAQTNQTINNKKPAHLNCISKICEASSKCLVAELVKDNIYSRSAIISPKKIVIFCYRK